MNYPNAISVEAEQSVLGGVLTDPAAALSLLAPCKLLPEHFYELRHRLIWSAAAGLAANGIEPDVVTTFERLNGDAEDVGGLPYLNALANGVHSVANIARHAQILIDKAAMRQKLSLLGEARTKILDGQSPAVVLAQVQAMGESQEAADRRTIVLPRTLDFGALAGLQPPPRHWLRAGWLGAGPTLFPGKGGQGKSTLAQHEATTGALGLSYFAPACDPYRSMVWNCEDEHDDVWRRQTQICEHEGIDIASLKDRLFLVSRYGCENALMAKWQNQLVTTPLMEELRQQVNDLEIEVLWLDNAAHFMLGDHDNRTEVTQFVNALNGLVVGRPFSVVIVGHVSRLDGSEFTGSAAWENAVRMRWYLGSKLPDQGGLDDGDRGAPDVRFLCKRKSNYSALDYVRFTMRDGLMVPDEQAGPGPSGIISAINERRAEEICIAGFKSLCDMGIRTTDGKTSPDYLPSQIVAKGLATGYTKFELGKAMNRLMGRGVFVRAAVGKHANRSPKLGLVLQNEVSQCTI